jgi:hypothetical protein
MTAGILVCCMPTTTVVFSKIHARVSLSFKAKGKNFRTWYTKSTGGVSKGSNRQKSSKTLGVQSIPGGTMTGIRTFIDGLGGTQGRDSRMMQSINSNDGIEDTWPLAETVPRKHYG